MTQPTLKKRAEFLRIRGGARWSTPTVTVETRPRSHVGGDGHGAASGSSAARPRSQVGGEGIVAASGSSAEGPARFGYTVTKKLGGAVERNRIRRRLKAAVDEVAAQHCRQGFDYVLVAKSAALTSSFESIKKDLEAAFERVHHPRREKRRS